MFDSDRRLFAAFGDVLREFAFLAKSAIKETKGTVTEDHIQRAAYFLWERAGKPEGRDREFWFQAESLLLSRYDRAA